ncbi:hypothetical protein IW261DRAFT_1593759 [Armillaria novae-zelandiae]|uniref:Heterokaryon incompatibility domain-containing protein n=1 Tax=Armillaria novae-zelandiae TaxID=153914 RepID=A0AA39P958_9AGAR|nr:hypothetical protein IW261DRAFT_1593759 [Armillaria novae-zelandiae]
MLRSSSLFTSSRVKTQIRDVRSDDVRNPGICSPMRMTDINNVLMELDLCSDGPSASPKFPSYHEEGGATWVPHSLLLHYDDDGLCAPELNKVVRKHPLIHYECPDRPKITLSALAETGNAELTIPVLKQRSYAGNEPVISSALADTPCDDLGIDGILEKFNATLGTSYSLGSKDLSPLRKAALQSILNPYVVRNDNFGIVYAHLRRIWCLCDVAAIEYASRIQEEEDTKTRRVLVQDRITRRDVPPRRVWDLYANRVVPYWVTNNRHPWGISHAWVDKNDHGYEWPVPMPKNANLDLIRIEMLNLGAEYAWLDVLCLRQEGGRGEYLCVEEWKLDVPTIGWVYESAHVVCYFNGLGCPLHLTLDYFESDRCWCRRAWTLQEITNDAIIGGETGDGIMENKVQKMFDEQLARLREMRKRNFTLELASEMQNRVSSKSLDKVAGLAYLLYPDCIPIYDAKKSDTDAWEVLMDIILSLCRAELFFYFPEPGNGNKFWRPSWQQIMTIKHFVPRSYLWPGDVRQGDTDGDWYEGYCIDSAYVRGLDEGLKEEKPRQGEMIFQNAAGFSCTFKILADHVYPIPDGSYVLIGASNGHSTCPLGLWVVGQLKEDGKFEKLSVFCLVDDEQVNLRKPGLEKVKISLC